MKGPHNGGAIRLTNLSLVVYSHYLTRVFVHPFGGTSWWIVPLLSGNLSSSLSNQVTFPQYSKISSTARLLPGN